MVFREHCFTVYVKSFSNSLENEGGFGYTLHNESTNRDKAALDLFEVYLYIESVNSL